MPFERPEIETDEDAITGRILDGIAERIPGWEAVEGAPEVALGEEIGREMMLLNVRAGDIIELAVAGFGETAFGVTVGQAAPAQIPVDLTVTAVGAQVPAGLLAVGVTDIGTEVAFELPDLVVAEGLTVAVTMVATEPGQVGNGVPVGVLDLATATATVTAATATGPSGGGLDAETIDTYLDRFVDYIATLRPGGVRASDLAALARSVPGVQRALGIDLYDPAVPAVPAERTATVFVVDAAGGPVSPQAVSAVTALLEESREVNFIIHVEDPTYTPVDLAYVAVAVAGADPAVVKAAVDAALTAYLSPATWGDTAANDQAWEPVEVVRYLDVVRAAGVVEDVDHLVSVTINGATADVNLAGPGALPASLTALDPSTIAGTVT